MRVKAGSGAAKPTQVAPFCLSPTSHLITSQNRSRSFAPPRAHQPYPVRLSRGERPGGERELSGDSLANDEREALQRAQVSGDADINLLRTETSV